MALIVVGRDLRVSFSYPLRQSERLVSLRQPFRSRTGVSGIQGVAPVEIVNAVDFYPGDVHHGMVGEVWASGLGSETRRERS